MIIISNGYKGVIFSLMAKGLELKWPGTLVNVAEDNSYTMVTNSKVNLVINGTTFAYPYLPWYFERETKFKEAEGKGYPVEYKILNKSTTQTFTVDTLDLVSDLVYKNKDRLNADQFKVGNTSSSKFALLTWSPDEFTLITNFMKEWVASRPVVIAGFERKFMWGVWRNYLTFSFNKALGHVEQAGFFQAFQQHYELWSPCISFSESMAGVKQRLVNKYTYSVPDSMLRVDTEKCLRGRLAGISSAKMAELSRPVVKALGMRDFKGIFYVLLYFLSLSLAVYTLETIASTMARQRLKGK